MVSVASGGQGCYRTKQLLTKAGHPGGDVAQHRWRIVVARPFDFFPRPAAESAPSSGVAVTCWCSSSRKSNRAIGPT